MKNLANLQWKDLCCKVLLLLKTEVLSCWQHWDNFQFLETECRFLAMCRYHVGTRQMTCAGCLILEMGDVGCAPVRYIRYNLSVWVADPTTVPSLATASPRCVLLWAEPVPSSPGGFGHKGLSSVSTAKLTWLMLYFDSCNDSFPCNTISSPTWSCVQIKGEPPSGLNHHGCADFMLAYVTNELEIYS